MGLFAEVVLHPGGIVAWGAVGLLAGWLAGKIMGGGNYGLILNIALGLTGALIGGFLYGLIMQSETGVGGDAGFWTSVAISFVGACLFLAVARHLGVGRKA